MHRHTEGCGLGDLDHGSTQISGRKLATRTDACASQKFHAHRVHTLSAGWGSLQPASTIAMLARHVPP